MASSTDEVQIAPSPNPVPGHMLSPSVTPRSPIPAPAPREAGAVGLVTDHDQVVVRLRPSGSVFLAPRAVPTPTPRSRTRQVHLALARSPHFAESLVYSATGALVIALVGLLTLGARRRLW